MSSAFQGPAPAPRGANTLQLSPASSASCPLRRPARPTPTAARHASTFSGARCEAASETEPRWLPQNLQKVAAGFSSRTATSFMPAPPEPGASAESRERTDEEKNSITDPASALSDPEVQKKLFVICGPSGVGKSVLIKRLLVEFPHSFGFSVSHTTRAARPGEVDGSDYHFLLLEDMELAIAEGRFLEWANVHGNLYGTAFSAVRDVIAEGRVCILDLDPQGVRAVMARAPTCLRIFIAPPSLEELERRLRGRGTESETCINRRIENSRQDMAFSRTPSVFSRVIVNEDLDLAYSQLRETVLPLLVSNANRQPEFSLSSYDGEYLEPSVFEEPVMS